MPHIDLPDGVPGIRSGFAFRPETAGPLCQLAEVLLRGPSTLSRGERELIATYVSNGNDCVYCRTSHGIYAGRQLAGGADTVAAVLDDVDSARVSTKVRALLRIADHVRVGGRSVTTEDVEAARSEGATDLEIHDTVLIAAAFCMFNRYVDGLATWTPTDPAVYEANADRLLDQGYVAIPDR
jgi:uncharacterized peroxidase-related enzyme